MNSVGYFVFEVPLVLRPYFLRVSALRDARRYLVRLIARELHTRGLSRYHWYGEGNGDEFADTLSKPAKFHPHLNMLIDHGFIGKKQLKRIRRLWSKWLYRYCGRHYHKTAPVYYRYYRAPGKRYHLARYVSRPTFKWLTESNVDFAKELYSFNNQSWFGKFTDENKEEGLTRFNAWLATLKGGKRPVVEVQTQEMFNSNICPICRAPLTLHRYKNKEGKWGCAEKRDDFVAIRDFGAGLYQVEPPPWWVHGEDKELLSDEVAE